LILNPAVGRSFSSFAMMIYKALLSIDLHIYNEFATRRIAHFLRRMAALQLLGMGRPKALPEGTREAGIGQRRGCRGRAYGALGCPPPAQGSHLPAEGTAPALRAHTTRIVAFRASHPAKPPSRQRGDLLSGSLSPLDMPPQPEPLHTLQIEREGSPPATGSATRRFVTPSFIVCHDRGEVQPEKTLLDLREKAAKNTSMNLTIVYRCPA